MLRTRNMESEVYVCKFIFSFVTQTLDNVSGFMPSLFVSIFVLFHIFMPIFCKRGGRGGDHALRSGTQIIDPSARARVTQLRARSRRAAGTAPELMIGLPRHGSRRCRVASPQRQEDIATTSPALNVMQTVASRAPPWPRGKRAPFEKMGRMHSSPSAMTRGRWDLPSMRAQCDAVLAC